MENDLVERAVCLAKEVKTNYQVVLQQWKEYNESWLKLIEEPRCSVPEKIRIHCELSEVNKELSDQSEYCASLGSAVCTLLWRVSRNEDSVHSFIVGSKVADFLIIVRHTMESYIATYQDEMPDEHTDESQFVLALCGIITNIAAFACGREFLVTNSNGRSLLETMISVLSNTPVNHSAKLRSLNLMCLYNVSINQKGLKYITRVEGIIPLLAWLLTAENEVENQVNTLQLLRSITSVSDKFLLQKVNEVLPNELLEQLVSSQNPSIKEIAVELMMDLQTLQNEP
ncbi:heat shock factor 2-binding protein-like isoform X2 [Ptychodera flava]|uniref:heat shock factor 2-binding protein-like isoform X2 n=1 Tax=Ptychodera flava TaxID=63121 RepID=UPI00396A86A8